MSEEERRERHRQNYMHVATHTAQVGGRDTEIAWADGGRETDGWEGVVTPDFACPTSHAQTSRPNSQAWADTFISELNDTHIEADLRLRHTPPDLNIGEVGSSRLFGSSHLQTARNVCK
jgi:trehalose 6-phosphate synthase/phosphatase